MRIFSFFALSAWLLAAGPAGAQIFSFGVKGGIPLTDTYSLPQADSLASFYSRPYTIGPTVELHLPFHFSVEVDALYRRNGFSAATAGPLPGLGLAFSRSAVNDWQFPVLGKVEKNWRLLRPFADAGPVYRHTSMTNNSNSAGVALGVGLSFKLPLIRISPEIRYTRWFDVPVPAASNIVVSTKNQADVLLGITF